MFCDLEDRIMSDPLSVPFDCPNCGAKYEIVRVEVPPQPTADREVRCVSCGGSLRGRHGMSFSNTSWWSVLDESGKSDDCCHESFIKSVQVAVGCKGSPFAFPKLKASVSTGAAGAFCYFAP